MSCETGQQQQGKIAPDQKRKESQKQYIYMCTCEHMPFRMYKYHYNFPVERFFFCRVPSVLLTLPLLHYYFFLPFYFSCLTEHDRKIFLPLDNIYGSFSFAYKYMANTYTYPYVCYTRMWDICYYSYTLLYVGLYCEMISVIVEWGGYNGEIFGSILYH